MKLAYKLFCTIGVHSWSAWQKTRMRGKYQRKCEHCGKLDTKYESA